MNYFDKLSAGFGAPTLSRGRTFLALLVALAADGLQILLPVPPAPEIVDVIAMGLTMGLLGFHLLLLPTFVVEFIPLVDMLPTWTGCVVAVIALRKRSEGSPAASTPPVVDAPPIDLSPRQIGEGASPRPRPTIDTPRRDDSNSPTL